MNTDVILASTAMKLLITVHSALCLLFELSVYFASKQNLIDSSDSVTDRKLASQLLDHTLTASVLS